MDEETYRKYLSLSDDDKSAVIAYIKELLEQEESA